MLNPKTLKVDICARVYLKGAIVYLRCGSIAHVMILGKTVYRRIGNRIRLF